MNIILQFLIATAIVIVIIYIWNWYWNWQVLHACKKIQRLLKKLGMKDKATKELTDKIQKIVTEIEEDI